MKAQEAHLVVEQAAEQLAESLKGGRSEQLKAYLKTVARFHSYSIGNILLIAMQRPDAGRVAGFHTWKALGRQVKRGAKGISIVAPVVTRMPKTTAEKMNEGEEPKTEERIVCFRVATVFDIADTEGKPLPDILRAEGNPGVYLERLREYITTRGIAVEYSESLSEAEGMSCGGKIVLQRHLLPAETFSVLLHELSHEMLHRGDDVPQTKTVRETEAEATAFVVCEAIGIESRQASADYVLLYNGNVETLRQSLHRIRKTAHRILEALLKEPTSIVAATEGAEVELATEAA